MKLENDRQSVSQSPYQNIPKEADIVPVLLDKKHKKLVFYSCPDPCHQGKFCSNCSAFSPLSN
jgi:hypothetical protein